MPALRTRTKIGDYWWPHRLVLQTLPEVNLNQKILLTGRPGSGKTTLIKRVVDKLSLSAGGFYTEEIREDSVLDSKSSRLLVKNLCLPMLILKQRSESENTDSICLG